MDLGTCPFRLDLGIELFEVLLVLLFLRGEGGFGGESGPKPGNIAPERAPDKVDTILEVLRGKGDAMLVRSYAWAIPTSAALLSGLVAGCALEPEAPSVPSVQAVVDGVSEAHYHTFHRHVENMGLGLYGGTEFDMGYRNRDYYIYDDSTSDEGPTNDDGPTLGNREACLYLQDMFHQYRFLHYH